MSKPLDVERLLFLSMEAEVISSLLSGNDTQCFNTEQYVNARDKWIANICNGCSRESLGIDIQSENDRHWHFEAARKQLRASTLVVEIESDIWVKKEEK